MKKIYHPFMLILYGPTGVGKTDFALKIANSVPAEIINMDMGQFYTPLCIGTAKPDWKNDPIPHHLFDIIDKPCNYTNSEYRNLAYATIRDVIARGKLPILVGGSGFYLQGLLTQSPLSSNPSFSCSDDATEGFFGTSTWDELYTIDPVRALQIDRADNYRIERALHIWRTTGKRPSSLAPLYNPEMDYYIIFVNRDRQDLIQRINDRVKEMFDAGWLNESEKLLKTDWQPFLCKKNLIGYPETFEYLMGEKNKNTFFQMFHLIDVKTRQYAKRQCTFWRKLEREIKKEKRYTGTYISCLDTVNLTNTDIDAYIKKLVSMWK